MTFKLKIFLISVSKMVHLFRQFFNPENFRDVTGTGSTRVVYQFQGVFSFSLEEHILSSKADSVVSRIFWRYISWLLDFIK